MIFNAGDDYYNEHDDEYNWADEIGWIHRESGTVVESHGGFETRNQRENHEEEDRQYREDLFRCRYG